MIVTLEGAPAVGKSATAVALGWPVVPEANALFGKLAATPDRHETYRLCQLERWRLAQRHAAAGGAAVLDGDVCQPIWFGTRFHDEDWGDFEATARFFDTAVRDGRVGLPDRFVVLTLDEATRAARERAWSLAAGRLPASVDAKVARYAAFAAFQHALFGALGDAFPGLVVFADAASRPPARAGFIRSLPPPARPASIDGLRFMVDWCRRWRATRAGGPPHAG